MSFFDIIGALVSGNTLSNSRQDLQGFAGANPVGFQNPFGNLSFGGGDQFGGGTGQFQFNPQQQAQQQ